MGLWGLIAAGLGAWGFYFGGSSRNDLVQTMWTGYALLFFPATATLILGLQADWALPLAIPILLVFLQAALLRGLWWWLQREVWGLGRGPTWTPRSWARPTCGALAILVIGCWFATLTVGKWQLRSELLAQYETLLEGPLTEVAPGVFESDGPAPFEPAPGPDSRTHEVAVVRIHATAWFPFLLRVERSGTYGSLSGSGETYWEGWFFGWHQQVALVRVWVS